MEVKEGIELLPQALKEEILKRANNKEYEYSDNKFFITELTGCLREAWFKRKYGKPPFELKSAFYILRGKWLDDLMNEYTQISQKRVTLPIRVGNEWIRISGYFDYVDDEGIITDLKTIKTLYYLKQKNAPIFAHKMQVIFYAFCEAEEKAKLLYVDISSADAMQFVFNVKENMDLIDKIKSNAKLLYTAIKKDDFGVLPKGESYMCINCAFKEKCNGAKKV